MVITIDGPAGSGKSTIARKLAARLEIAYLDTGAMYRAIAHAALQRGVDLADRGALLELAKSVRLELDCGPTHTRVRVDGHDVSEAIRGMAVSAATSPVARHQGIRDLLVEQQRALGRTLDSFISEGRDQGSVVFPSADIKFVLEASLEARARRRLQDLGAEGEKVTLSAVRENLQARDEVDSKQWDALLLPGAATVIDTTGLAIQEVIDQMLSVVRRHAPDAVPPKCN
ncbi:MAG: (d)CMP kinase [Planctomycetes bacterium]|nr:(d)CMP kinase [Planctomycetota bacterium]